MSSLLDWLRRAAGRFFGSRVAFHVVFALLLFVPHFFGSRESPAPYHLGIPRIHSGDEPHYLVMIHSIVDDGDLSLGNNYDKVHAGSLDAGLLFRGSDLDHHSVWFVDGKRIHWAEVFRRPPPWNKDAEGHPVPTVMPGIDPRLIPQIERPWNSSGFPLLLSPFFFALRAIGLASWYEPASTIFSALVIVVASILWRLLASGFTKDRTIINVSMAFAFLGTPAYHYARSFFSEPYLLCLITGAYLFSIVRPRFVLAGFLIGVTLFIKPIAVLMGLPIGVMLLWRRSWGDVVRFSAPVALWVGAVLVQNMILYGGPLNSSNEFKFGAPIANGLQLLANPVRGLLTTAPIVFLSIAGWAALVKQSRTALAALAACVLFFVVAACNHAWSGGYCYSLRFLVPLMPIFCLGAIPLLQGPFRRFVIFVGVLSICINFCAAVQYWRAFHNHPFLYLIPSSEWDAAPTA